MVLHVVANHSPSGLAGSIPAQGVLVTILNFILLKIGSKMRETIKKLIMKKGTQYKFCTCGHSKIIPFCDESHKELNEKTGSGYKSLRIIPEKDIKINISSKNWNFNTKKIVR